MIFVATRLFTERILHAMSGERYAELQGHHVYLKNERENLTEDQKNMMRQIAEDYKHE